jgi:hypothetical protein
MRTLTLVAGAALALCFVSPGWAQHDAAGAAGATADLAGAQQAATAALPVLRRLVTAANAQQMGFRSPEEAATATLQEPLPIYLVRLDRLRQYDPAQDANALLTGGQKVFFPVAVGGEVRSSIVVDRQGNAWKVVSFGNPALAKALAQARSAGGGAVGATAIVVHVAALNLYLLGQRSGGQLTLAPVTADPRLKGRPFEPRPASEVFGELVPLAQKYNGLPM